MTDKLTTDYVRQYVAWDYYNDEAWPEQGAEFDLWLAETKAQVLEDFADTYSYSGSNTDGIDAASLSERSWILELARRRAAIIRQAGTVT